MGNISNYDIYFPPARTITRADVETTLAIAAGKGYMPQFPLVFTSVDGGEGPPVESTSELTRRLEEGGLVMLNRAASEIMVSTDPERRVLSLGALFQLRPTRAEAISEDFECLQQRRIGDTNSQ